MGKRRSGRELAFRLLFQLEMSGAAPEEVFETARAASESSSEVWVFARHLALGAWQARETTDTLITRFASGWTLERLASVDRCLLRLALYEIFNRDDIPTSVSVNEAVELAKKYSTADSARFVNGVLGAILRDRETQKPEAQKTESQQPEAQQPEAQQAKAQQAEA